MQQTINNLPHVQQFLSMAKEDFSRRGTKYIVNAGVLFYLIEESQELIKQPQFKPTLVSFLNQCERFLSGSFRFQIKLDRDFTTSVHEAGSEELLKSQLETELRKWIPESKVLKVWNSSLGMEVESPNIGVVPLCTKTPPFEDVISISIASSLEFNPLLLLESSDKYLSKASSKVDGDSLKAQILDAASSGKFTLDQVSHLVNMYNFLKLAENGLNISPSRGSKNYRNIYITARNNSSANYNNMLEFYIDPATPLSTIQKAIEQNKLLINDDVSQVQEFISNSIVIQVLQPNSDDADEDSWQDYSIYSKDCKKWKVVKEDTNTFLELNTGLFTIESCLLEFSNSAGIFYIQPKHN